MLAGHVVSVVPKKSLVASVALHRDLRRTEFLEGRDDLCDVGLPLGREHIVGLHVEDVMSRVGHVVDPDHQHLGAPRRSGRLRRRFLRDGGKYPSECQCEQAVKFLHKTLSTNGRLLTAATRPPARWRLTCTGTWRTNR
jgi:hypothetical protein